MPMQWLHVLTHPDIKDKSECMYKLQYQYTVSDVFDLIESLDVLDTYKIEQQKIAKREENKNNSSRH